MARNPFADGLRTENGFLQASMFKAYCQNGVSAAGPVTTAGTAVGDQVIAVLDVTDASNVSSSFESRVTVAGQIQQTSATNYSAKVLIFLLAAQSST